MEGAVVNLEGYFSRFLKSSKTDVSLRPNLRYGFSNGHLNGGLDLTIRTRDLDSDNRLRRHAWHFAGGSRVSQFNKESPITPLVNSISTLLYGDNLMKIYENVFATAGYSKRFETGLRVGINALYEDRKPLDNTTNFTLFKKDSVNITPNYPFADFEVSEFARHQAFLLSIDLSIKPGQKFIQYPNRKISIVSNIPTFALNYTRGLDGLFGSDVRFDKWRFTVFDDKNFKLAGMLRYKIGIGGFLNRNSVYIQDYQHFNGNRSVSASEYLNSFQLAPYYSNSTIATFYNIIHLEHHFNGFLTNKIPLFNRLNWNLVVGTNTFFVNQDNNYSEAFNVL